MPQGRPIFRAALAFLGLVLRERIANAISVLMMLFAIVYVVAIAYATVRWVGSAWLFVTMPVGIVLGVPAMRAMAELSQRITDEPPSRSS
jgi:uncharacterized membrane protein (DUF485 family)